MKRSALAFAVFVILLGLTPKSASAGSCRAEAEVQNFWEEKGGFILKAKVKVEVKSARPGAFVTVYVDSKFNIERTDGSYSNKESRKGSVGIDTEDHSTETFVIEAVHSVCSVERPWKINDVEIVDVSCYD